MTTDVKSEAAQDSTKNELAILKRSVVDVVQERVETLVGRGDLQLPTNYSTGNAMASAWLTLQSVEDKDGNKALAVCERDTIANALLDMAIQGLSPARDQCYFIVYGKTLTCQRSYFGTVSVLRRIYGPEADVRAVEIYDGDEFETEIHHGMRTIRRHVQKFSDVDNDKLVGAYAIVERGGDYPPIVEVMTMEKIRKAWKMGKAGGTSKAHINFPDEMAKRTVINRAVKMAINSADDSYLVEAVLRQSALSAEARLDAQIDEEANTGPVLDLGSEPEPEPEEPEPEEPEPEPEPPAEPRKRPITDRRPDLPIKPNF
jgi:recombination protein RecT